MTERYRDGLQGERNLRVGEVRAAGDPLMTEFSLGVQREGGRTVRKNIEGGSRKMGESAPFIH